MLKPRRYMFVVCLLTLAVGAFAQQTSIDLNTIDPSQLNLANADLSGMKFYFEGPMEIYATGLRYNGMLISAILNYDGKGNLTVKQLFQGQDFQGKRLAVDLSGVTVEPTADGVKLVNIGIDGADITATMKLASPTSLALAPNGLVQTGTMASAAQAAGAQVSSLQSQVSGLQSQVGSLQSQVSTLQGQVSDRDNTIASLQQKLSAASGAPTAVPGSPMPPAASDYPNIVASGFGGGKSQLGTWVVSGNTLQQQNVSSLFAKYTASVPQYNMQYFYQFTGTAVGNGWRGYGAHILESGSSTANGYGYGDSYLIWVTRDQGNLQTDKTFVQLYRSYDDVHIVQIASQAIDSPISQSNTIGVAVDRANNTITVIANGKEVFKYQASGNISGGNGIALRALGTVSFSSAQIRTK